MQKIYLINVDAYDSVEDAKKDDEVLEFEVNNEFEGDHVSKRYGAFYRDIIDNIDRTVDACSKMISSGCLKAFIWREGEGYVEASLENFAYSGD